jgi:hypothetical protein
MKKLSIIIPSRKQDNQESFIERAVTSVRSQNNASNFETEFLIGVDKGCSLDAKFSSRLQITCVESSGRSQASALNAAISSLRHEDGFVAFLEDDDQWLKGYLDCASSLITMCDFISSTQIEFNENNEVVRINDFPTPSGWFMPIATLLKIGKFNEQNRFHLDNEWLGRLSRSGLRRIHMIESTAPIDKNHIKAIRPWLFNLLKNSTSQLARHQSPYPLVRRLVHSKSGMSQISSNKDLNVISKNELKKLVEDFGNIPW